MKNEKYLIYGLIAVYLLRFITSVSMGLMPQDAYYYFYSEHPALSYFDHPPMVAYMLKLFSFFFGKSVWAVKLTDFLVTFFSFGLFYRLGSNFLSTRKNRNALIFYGTTFLLTILSINTTPDVPLIFFWTLSLLAAYRAITDSKWYYWALTGILMGLAFDSKYTAVFLPAGMVLFLILSNKHRKYLFSKELFLLLFFFVLAIFPVFYWNVQNDWISFKFQSSERTSDISNFNLSPKLFFGNLGTQIGLLIPVLFTGMLVVFYKYFKKNFNFKVFNKDNDLFLLSFSLPIILFFFGVSLFYWVKLNWIMPGYITAIIFVARYLPVKWLRWQIVVAALLHVLLFVQVVFYPVNVKSDDTWYGWEEFSDAVKALKQQHPDAFLFSDDGYKTSAELEFFTNDTVYAGNVLGKHALQFSLVYPDLNHLKGKSALFIDSDTKLKNENRAVKTPEKLQKYFSKVTQLEPVLIKKPNGKLVRKFYIYRCENYKGVD